MPRVQKVLISVSVGLAMFLGAEGLTYWGISARVQSYVRALEQQAEFQGLVLDAGGNPALFRDLLEKQEGLHVNRLSVSRVAGQNFERSYSSKESRFADCWLNRFEAVARGAGVVYSAEIVTSVYYLALELLLGIGSTAVAWLLLRAVERRTDTRVREEVGRRRIEMAAQVAHDIRSPLAAIRTIESELVHESAERRALLREAIERLSGIASQVLGERSLYDHDNLETIHLAVEAQKVLDEKRLGHGVSEQVRLVSDGIYAGYGTYVLADLVQVRSAISNLVNNALESLEGKGDISVSLLPDRGSLVLRIEDTGKGMPISVLGRVGTRGFSFGKKDGNGLGVSHAKTMMERLGGQFRIHSEDRKGTVVELVFPTVERPRL